MNQHFDTCSKKGRGWRKRPSLIQAMRGIAKAAQPITGRGIGYKLFTAGDPLQPLSIEPDAEMVSSVKVTHAELDEFIAVYRAACEEALSDAPRLERGA